MQVPVYQPKVGIDALPSARMENPVTPGLAGGAAAQQLAQVGQGLERTADTLMAAEFRIQRERDADMAARTEAGLREEYIAFQTQARQRRGADAYGLASEAKQWWDDKLTKTTEGLENDNQRRAVSMMVGRLRTSSIESMAGYETEQRRDSLINSSTALVTSARNSAASDPLNDTAREDALGKIAAGVTVIGNAKGWTPEERTAALDAEVGALHDKVARALVNQGKFAKATEYVEKNLASIKDADTRDRLTAFVRNANDVQLGDDRAIAVWKEMGPKTDIAPVELDKMVAALRDDPALKDNPTARRNAIQALKEQAGLHNSSQSERFNANKNEVIGMIDKRVPMSKVETSEAWAALPKAMQKEVHDMIARDQAVAASRAASEEQRRFAAEGRKLTAMQREQSMLFLENADVYHAYSDPAKLATMKREEVMALRTKIGNEATSQLLNRYDSMQKGTGRMDATIDKEVFEQAAERAGLNPYDPKKSEAERKNLGSFKLYIEQQINAAQVKAKRVLDRTEKEELVQRLLDDQVIIQSRMPTDWFDSKPVPVGAVPMDRLENAYVMVGDQKVFSRTIPPADRLQIIEALQSKGRAVSEKAIAELYQAGKPASR